MEKLAGKEEEAVHASCRWHPLVKGCGTSRFVTLKKGKTSWKVKKRREFGWGMHEAVAEFS
jgi:hypothetical protein